MTFNMMDIDAQLCQLLGTLSLEGQRRKTTFANEVLSQTSRTQRTADAAMSDSSDGEDSTYQLNPSSSSSDSSSSSSYASASDDAPPPPPPNCGCAYLQAIHAQIRAGSYSTTSGEYLESIFTHREALFAYPQGHRMCAVGFSELAGDLERRDRGRRWTQPDWDGDSEAVAAFRHEAWVIATTF